MAEPEGPPWSRGDPFGPYAGNHLADYYFDEPGPWVHVELALHETAEGASGHLAQWVDRYEPKAERTFDVANDADEAKGMVVVASPPDEDSVTYVLLRLDRVMAFVILASYGSDDVTEEAQEIGAKLAGRIREVSAD